MRFLFHLHGNFSPTWFFREGGKGTKRTSFLFMIWWIVKWKNGSGTPNLESIIVTSHNTILITKTYLAHTNHACLSFHTFTLKKCIFTTSHREKRFSRNHVDLWGGAHKGTVRPAVQDIMSRRNIFWSDIGPLLLNIVRYPAFFS